MLNLVQGYLSMFFLLKILNYLKNGFKLWKVKTGYQTNTALSVTVTLNHPVLLSDQEKLGADCMTIQFQQFSLPFLHTNKKSRERKNCQWKGCIILTKRAEKEKTANEKGVCFTTKVPWTSTIKSCKGSWKWTLICLYHRQCTLWDESWKRQWNFWCKRFYDKKTENMGRVYEKPKRQTIGFKSTTQSLRPQYITYIKWSEPKSEV